MFLEQEYLRWMTAAKGPEQQGWKLAGTVEQTKRHRTLRSLRCRE
jgi:hypothetical protein